MTDPIGALIKAAAAVPESVTRLVFILTKRAKLEAVAAVENNGAKRRK